MLRRKLYWRWSSKSCSDGGIYCRYEGGQVLAELSMVIQMSEAPLMESSSGETDAALAGMQPRSPSSIQIRLRAV